MKKLITIFALFLAFAASAQTEREKAVLDNIAALNKAVFTDLDKRDSATLDRLLSGKATYGHSSGLIENKQQMIRHAVSSPTTYGDFRMENATVFFEGNTAVSRHELKAKTFENGKEGVLHLGVLQTWVKAGKSWKLLARQAVKLP